MTITTTLRRLQAAGACKPLYEHLKEALGPIGPNDPINALQILEYNGVVDLEWFLNSSACIENPKPALAEYKRITDSAWTEYKRITDSAWTEHNRITDSAWTEHNRIMDSARAEYQRIEDPAWATILKN